MRYLLFVLLLSAMACQRKAPLQHAVISGGVKDSAALAVTAPAHDTGVVNYGDVFRSFLEMGDTVFTVLKGQKDSFMFTYQDFDSFLILRCYKLTDSRWKNAGYFRTERAGDRFETADMNFDGVEEMILSSGPNMNGNEWKQVYIFDTLRQNMIYAGELSGDIQLNRRNKTIQQTYTGSWYMAEFETQYNWVDNRLHLIKTITDYFETDPTTISNTPRRCAIYMNYSPRGEDNEEVWHGNLARDSARYDSLWRHFFDR